MVPYRPPAQCSSIFLPRSRHFRHLSYSVCMERLHDQLSVPLFLHEPLIHTEHPTSADSDPSHIEPTHCLRKPLRKGQSVVFTRHEYITYTNLQMSDTIALSTHLSLVILNILVFDSSTLRTVQNRARYETPN